MRRRPFAFFVWPEFGGRPPGKLRFRNQAPVPVRRFRQGKTPNQSSLRHQFLVLWIKPGQDMNEKNSFLGLISVQSVGFSTALALPDDGFPTFRYPMPVLSLLQSLRDALLSLPALSRGSGSNHPAGIPLPTLVRRGRGFSPRYTGKRDPFPGRAGFRDQGQESFGRLRGGGKPQ